MSTTPRHSYALAFIFVTILIDSIGFGIILPVTPELIMQLTGEGLGSAARYGGWLYFSYAVMQFFCAPLLGNLSDRYGRRPVLLFSLAALGLDYLVMGVAPTLSWLFFGRIVAGAAGASYVPAYAYIADVTPADRRAQNFGLLGAAFGLGFIIGPAIGGVLGSWGPRAPFFAAALLALLNLALGVFALPESLPHERRRSFDLRRANPLGTLLQLRKHNAVLGLAAVAFLWQLGHQVLPSTWAFYTMLRFGWSEAAVGYSLAAAGIVMAVSQSMLTRAVIPRLGERRAALVGLLGGVAVYCCYAFATQSWMLYVGIVTWMIGALAWPSLNAMMSQRVPATAQGELQGGVASIGSLAAILGPPLMTQLFGYFTSASAAVRFAGAPFLAAATLALFGAALFWTMTSRAAPAAERESTGTL
jgi:DHA1 family tetracycline resistance protein-like MFS transporter